MRKLSALIVVLLVAVTLSGYLGWQVQEQYKNTQAQAITALNKSLHPHNLKIECRYATEWAGFLRHETCNLERLSRPLVLLELWQNVTISPLGVHAEFGVNPSTGFVLDFFPLSPLFQTQKGSWQLPIGQTQIEFTYKTGAMDNSSIPSTELLVSPIQIRGQFDLSSPYSSQVKVHIDEVKLEQLSQKFHLKGLKLEANSVQKQDSRFFERSELSMAFLDLSSAGSNLSVRHLLIQQANMLDEKKLASLNQLDFESLRINSGELDLRLDSNELNFYLDNIDWPSLRELNNQFQLSKTPSLEAYETLLAQGVFLNLDKLESTFIYQDRTSALLGMSGDVILNGELRLLTPKSSQPINSLEQRVKAKLTLNLSRSLMLGPQAGLMMDFIDQGWLYQQGDRLIGNVYYANGKLLANGNIVSTLALLPDYIEDH